ncbi:MAG TPA: c-type cytochrome [Rhodoblastus sp.]|nr:c-type cytochrome [Rhodoblastus sp.]
MRQIGLMIAAVAISLAAAGPLAAQQPDAAYPFALLPLPPAKEPPVKNCTFCHGTYGQGLATAPRLAGQRAAYLEKELNAFRDRQRDNPLSKLYMWNAVANLHPDTARELAQYFAQVAPRPAADGNRGLVEQGRALYQQGIAEANVVTCVACHGPNAEGVRDIPRLGGLSALYLKRRMEEWKLGYHPTATPMPAVTRELSEGEIEALASYLSFLGDQTASQ